MKMNLSNPVLVKELKLRFRSFKSFSGILFYLIAMIVFVFGFIAVTTIFSGTTFFRPSESFFLFSMLTFIQMGLILFITPGLTAGSISTEREKQTLNILLTTSQSSFQIIFGKMTSSIAFLLLLIVAGLPIYSLVFLFGGISPSQLAVIFGFYIITLIALGSIGVMFSTMIRKTVVSIIATYGTMIFLSFVTGFFFLISSSLMGFSGAVSNSPGVVQTATPFAHFWASINPAVLLTTILQPNFGTEFYNLTKIRFPIWAGYLIFYSLISIVCTWISVKRLRVNMRKQK